MVMHGPANANVK